jgi:PAS domain S-box-containing protein
LSYARSGNPLDRADAVALTLDGEGRLGYVNRAAERLFGQPAEALVGVRLVDRFVPDDEREAAWTRFESLLSGCPVAQPVLQPLLIAGRRIPMTWQCSPLRDPDGRVVGVLTLGSPDSARPRAAEQGEGTAQIEALLETSRIGIVVVHADPATRQRIIRRCNQRMADILGYDSANELLGRCVDRLHVSQQASDFFGARHFDALSNHEKLHIEYQLRHTTRGPIWCLLSGKAIDQSMPADLTKGVVWIVDDISARKEMERALVDAGEAAEQASRAKSRFLANMSHELRTPLNAILGFSEIMTLETYGPLAARYKDYARLIHHSGRHLIDVINQILDLAKIEAGKVELTIANHAMHDVVDDVLVLMRDAAVNRGLFLRNETHCLHELHFDRLRIRQALLNVVGNAIKFTPSGGVTIRNACSGGWHGIVVEDTGCGMSADEVKVALQPFGQIGQESYVRANEGTGLGLTVSQEIMRLHGGSLNIESQPGQGTAVTLLLPEGLNGRLGSAKGGFDGDGT